MAARKTRALTLTTGVMLAIAPVVVSSADGIQEYTPERIAAHLATRVGRGLGPPGGEVRSLVVAPSEPARLYLGTAMGHVYASLDAAESWEELPVALGHNAVVDNLLVHPGDADVVFAAYWTPQGSGGLARTSDGGATWESLSLPGDPSLRSIAVAPSRVSTMYVGGIGGVWRSDDGGGSWRNVNGPGLVAEFVESLAVDPRDPDHVYAGTWRQVYRSHDGGETWQRVYQGMAVDRDIFSLAIDPNDPDTVLAGTCNFLYCSNDAGGSWEERRTGVSPAHNRIHTIIHDPRNREVIYAGTRGALYQSTDSGINWSILLGGVSVSALALGPRGDQLFVATEERGVLAGTASHGFGERNRGLYSARVVAFDALPGAPRILFAARSDGPLRESVHISTDIGQTWRPLGVTPSIGPIRFLRAQIEPINRALVVGETGWWSAFPRGRWAPVSAPPGEVAALEIAHAVDGYVIAATSSGLYAAAATDLDDKQGAAQAFDADARPVWRALWSGAAVEALTIGDTFALAVGDGWVVRGDLRELVTGQKPQTAKLNGLPGGVEDLALHPENRNIAYAVTASAIYRTEDGGAKWAQVPIPWPASGLRAVEVDPANPDQVLALDYSGALYRGHGEGQHWLVLDEDPGLDRAWALRLSAQALGYALVATRGHGLRVVDIDPLAARTADRGSKPDA